MIILKGKVEAQNYLFLLRRVKTIRFTQRLDPIRISRILKLKFVKMVIRMIRLYFINKIGIYGSKFISQSRILICF